MISPWMIYWITRLDSIQMMVGIFTGVLAVVGIVGGVICIIITAEEEWETYWPPFKKTLKMAIFIAIPVLLIGTVVPTTKEMIAIYAIPKIANNEDISQIPSNFAKLINEKLKEWMEDVDILPAEKNE